MPEPNRSGSFFLRKDETMRTLLQIFQDTKEVLCRYDYYIHTKKCILHLTNSETKIPHLMGMQYIGKPGQFTGDFGVYAIKKQRVTMESIEKLVRNYYKTEEKQRRMLEMIHRKMDNYQNDRDRDSFFRNLSHRYEITKIVRENKDTRHKEVIYQSMEAEQREKSGIEKMLVAAGVQTNEKLIKFIFRLNKKFGIYHTVDMLNDSEVLFGKCTDKRQKNLVADFYALWEEKENGM